MGMSRREFFQQLFSRKTLETINPLSSNQLDELIEIVQPSPKSVEEAGMGLINIKKRSAVASTVVEEPPKSQKPVAVVAPAGTKQEN